MTSAARLTRGDARHPPLIFLHGFLGCKEDWEEMLPSFEENYFCIAIDLPGHGKTPYSADMIRTLREEILQMTREKPTLIGYSMGGRLALECMDIARAVAVLSGHPGLQTEEEKRERLYKDQQWSERLLALPFDAFLSEWYAQALFKHMPRSALKRRQQQQDPQALSSVLVQMSLGHQKRHCAFSCPTLFLYGEYDEKYRKVYLDFLESATVHEVQKCGHALHLENAALSGKMILYWLKSQEEIHANAH